MAREASNDNKKMQQQKGSGNGGGFVDNFKTNICKEQAKRLILSNSNAFLEGEAVLKNVAEAKENNIKAKMRKKNIDILDTNHQLLIDHQITASNM